VAHDEHNRHRHVFPFCGHYAGHHCLGVKTNQDTFGLLRGRQEHRRLSKRTRNCRRLYVGSHLSGCNRAGLQYRDGRHAVHHRWNPGLGTLGWAVILLLVAERLRNLGQYTFSDVVAFRLARKPVRTMSAIGSLAVAIPYLLAQMVGAGALIQILFGLPYEVAVVLVGVLMTLYVMFGGMLATTWIQTIKAVLLLIGGTIIAFGVMSMMNFDFGDLLTAAVKEHPKGSAIMAPGVMFTDIITVISIGLAFVFGTAGLPHVLMRFFTVPNARQARRSVAYAIGFIGYFQSLIFIIGMGAIVYVTNNPEFLSADGSLLGGSNMSAIHLSKVIRRLPRPVRQCHKGWQCRSRYGIAYFPHHHACDRFVHHGPGHPA